jgi:hypothetical protein
LKSESQSRAGCHRNSKAKNLKRLFLEAPGEEILVYLNIDGANSYLSPILKKRHTAKHLSS